MQKTAVWSSSYINPGCIVRVDSSQTPLQPYHSLNQPLRNFQHDMQFSRYFVSARTTLRSSTTVRPSFLLARAFATSVISSGAQGQSRKIVQPTLGVAAAMKAMEDSSFKPKVQIFEEFAMKDGVAVVCCFPSDWIWSDTDAL